MSFGGADMAPKDYRVRIISELNRQFFVSVINGRDIYATALPTAFSKQANFAVFSYDFLEFCTGFS